MSALPLGSPGRKFESNFPLAAAFRPNINDPAFSVLRLTIHQQKPLAPLHGRREGKDSAVGIQRQHGRHIVKSGVVYGPAVNEHRRSQQHSLAAAISLTRLRNGD